MQNQSEWVAGVSYPSYMTEESIQMLKGGYLLPSETPKDAMLRCAKAAADRLYKLAADNNTDFNDLPDLTEKFFDIMWNNSFCMSSPMWSNLGTKRGLPISCYGTNIPDSIAGIALAHGEVMVMSALGGGTSANFTNIRKKGDAIAGKGYSKGSPFFAEFFEYLIQRVDQGEVRKGAFAGFLDIDHGDYWDFMKFRSRDSDVQRMTTGILVSNDFVERLKARGEVELEKWAALLKSRSEKGLPYIFFSDNVNNNKPECYVDDLIEATNLCTEIMLPTNELESFVCCVASLNAMNYDLWSSKDDESVFYAILFMEGVMEDFIVKLEESDEATKTMMSRALRFAKRHRALGLGVLGYHSYLQSKMIPFESAEANIINAQMFATLKAKSHAASAYLASKLGETEKTIGTGRRHTTTNAQAPTTSNASISGGWSPSSEVTMANYYVVKLAKGKFIRKNMFLEQKLIELGFSDGERLVMWEKIMKDGGSVQGIDEIPQNIKEVFKTFKETNQMEIIRQAAIRQKYIDQGQSLNLNFPPETAPKDINYVILKAHELGIKALYYQRSETILRKELNTLDDKGCLSCEG